MQGTNLNVNIVANAEKFNQEIIKTGLLIKNFTRQASKALTKGDAAGFEAYTKEAAKLKAVLPGLERELAQTGAIAQSTGRSVALSARSFSSLHQAVLGVSRSLGAAKAGMVAFAAVKGIEAIVSVIKSAADELQKVKDLSAEIGRKPLATQASIEIAKEAGLTEEEATKAIQARSDAITKLMTATREQTTFQGVRTMRGQGPAEAGQQAEDAAGKMQTLQAFSERAVETFRGGVPVVKDYSDALKVVGINAEAFERLSAAAKDRTIDQALIAYAKNAEKAGVSVEELNAVSKQLIGLPMVKALAFANAELANMQKKTDELSKSQRGATEENLRLAEQQRQAEVKLEQAKQEAAAATLLTLGETNKAAMEAQAAALKAGAAYAQQLREQQALGDNMSRVTDIDQIRTDWTVVVPDIFKGFTNEIGNAFGKMFEVIGNGFINSAQAAEKAGPAMSFSFKSVASSADAAAKAADAVTNSIQASAAATLNLAEAATAVGNAVQGAGGPQVFRGSGTGDTGGHGPGSRATQSITPGTSDYQAPPPKVVYPMDESAANGWEPAARSAAESSAEAAKAAQAAAEASKQAVDAWVQKDSGSGMAAGGFVSGAGTGTSDSIAARLSNGEFVMRAAAVRAWGSDFMSAMNAMRNPFAGFAAGGLVGHGFADGGLVTAGGGTPVHLHLGGQSFALSGAGSVVDALVVEANRQHIRSAGVKPSWYGGRPGGR